MHAKAAAKWFCSHGKISVTADGFTVFSKLQPKINKNNLSGHDVVIVQFRLYDVILKKSISFLSSNVFDY